MQVYPIPLYEFSDWLDRHFSALQHCRRHNSPFFTTCDRARIHTYLWRVPPDFLRVFANVDLQVAEKILQKPESYIAVSYTYNEYLSFGGSFDPAFLLSVVSTMCTLFEWKSSSYLRSLSPLLALRTIIMVYWTDFPRKYQPTGKRAIQPRIFQVLQGEARYRRN